MVSCGNKAENAEVADAIDTVAVEEVVAVEEAVDTTVAPADTVVAVVEEVAAATAE